MKSKKKRLAEKQQLQSRKLAVFFILIVVTIILATVAIVWSFGVILAATGIDFLEELSVTNGFYVAAALVASAIIGTLLAVIVGKLLLHPFQSLIKGMISLSNGDYTVRLDLSDKLASITPFKDINEGFNSMACELENTELLRGDFINNFSHEFKTPIASIKGLLDLMKKEKLPEKKRLEYIAVIEEETDRLLQMSSNVLNLTKVEKENVLKGVEAYNLSEQIRGCILLLEKKWSRKELSLSLDLDEYNIEANPDLMKQVFVNLLDNAIKFSNDGGELAVKIDSDGELVSVRIQNEGIAISDEEKQKIFNKFYQSDTTHAKEGNGIGLSIVKHIVELHHGAVTVESDGGKTAFTVTVPEVTG